MKPILTSLFLLIIIYIPLNAQQTNLAEFNNGSITKEDFLKRFELTPRIRSSNDIDSQKIHFLFTLISEKLWANEAKELNLDTINIYRQYRNNLEKLLVRDALFKKVISSKVNLKQEEIAEGLERQKVKLGFKFIFSNKRSEIDSLYKLLDNISVDSVLTGRPELQEQPEPIEVEFGQISEELEDILFSLNINEYTAPQESEIGWTIYCLISKKPAAEDGKKDFQKKLSEVKRTLEERRLQRLTIEYANNLLGGVSINAVGNLFQFLSEQLLSAFQSKYGDKKEKIYYLYEQDIINLINRLSDFQKQKVFVKFEKNPVTFEEFLYYIYFNNFSTSEVSLNSVKNSLNSALREFIRVEVITREGYKRNLQNSAPVKEELKMWEDNFLAQYLKNTYNKKAAVTDAELEKYISQKRDTLVSSKHVRIIEIKHLSLEQTQAIFESLRSGIELEIIISQMNFSENNLYVSDSPEALSKFGEMSLIIDEMKIGQVYGPVVKSQGYSIIKLLEAEKKEIPFEVKNKLQLDLERQILFYKKLKKLLEEKTVELARKYELDINEEMLKSIKVTEIPAFVYRYYGFGGKTVAAPFVNLFYQWIEEYYKQKNEAL